MLNSDTQTGFQLSVFTSLETRVFNFRFQKVEQRSCVHGRKHADLLSRSCDMRFGERLNEISIEGNKEAIMEMLLLLRHRSRE